VDDNSEPSDVVQIDIPADVRFLGLVRSCVLESLRLDAPDGHDPQLPDMVALAVHEVCTNQIAHAYRGRGGGRLCVTVTVSGAPRSIVVETLDTGSAIDLQRHAALARWTAPDSADETTVAFSQLPVPGPSTEGGYGLYLITTIMDEVTYSTAPTSNRWRLVKRLAVSPSP
jgi:anti-sigma regulatory factor (Ser/Thr protein kinase)